MFRVVVVKHERVRNPDYVSGTGTPYWILTHEQYTTQFGPYGTLGTAKSILTKETWDTLDNRLRFGVVEGWIEEATTTWKKVDL